MPTLVPSSDTGGKLERLNFPLPMTHRAAHFFLLAPKTFSIPAALHYGQIRALGGKESLIYAVSETFLSDWQLDEAFWYSVLQFFVNHPELPAYQFGPVADFLRFRQFGGNGTDGPEPNLSMKGRTVDALMRRVHEWHEELAKLDRKSPRKTWEPSFVRPFALEEQDFLSPPPASGKLSN